MINLIPPKKRKELHAMRQNTLLLRYVIATLIVLGLVLVINIGTFIVMKTTENSARRSADDNNARVADYANVRQQAEEYTKNLALAKQMFDRNVPYADVVIGLAKTLPEGVLLESITLSPAITSSPTTLNERAKSYQAAINLKNQLNRSNIAKDVSIASINTDGSVQGAQAGDYPLSVVINVTFTDKLLRPKGDA